MAVKLIAIDMDGTLLDSKKNIPEKNLEAMQWAMDRGVDVAIATGRLGDELSDVIDLLPNIRYSIQANGAYLYDHQEKKTIHASAMSADDVREIYARLKGFDMMFEVFAEDGIYTDQACMDDLEHYAITHLKRLIDSSRTGLPSVADYIQTRTGEVGKINIFFPDASIRDKALEKVKDMPFSIIFQEVNTIEFNQLGMNKSMGLEALTHHLGITPDEVMALGDGINDIQMLEYAGYSVAMENAREEVKAISKYTTASCDDAGVAEAIYRFVE